MEENEEYIEKETKDHINIVIIGHVDAGKSTLGGKLLYMMGYVDERILEKHKKESIEKGMEKFLWAYIMDLSEEERERGKTVDVSRAFFETKTKRYTILDAPGHRSYIGNMITGTAQADVAILVISAKKGEYEAGFEKDGQTREHIILAKTMGVKKIIIAINKMDDSTVEWDFNRYDKICKELGKYIKNIGYDKNVLYIPISAYNGINLLSVDKKLVPYYQGSCLTDILDNLNITHKYKDSSLRIPVIDKYKDKGNTIILGKIESGNITVGDKIIIMPNKYQAYISKINLHQKSVKYASSGDNIQLTLKTDLDFSIGSLICSINDPLYPIQEFVGKFYVLNHKPIFTIGYKANLHIHTLIVPCTITKLLTKFTDSELNSIKNPSYAQSGYNYTAIMTVDYPICIEKDEILPSLGRFTLREDKTIAIGKVLLLKPLK